MASECDPTDIPVDVLPPFFFTLNHQHYVLSDETPPQFVDTGIVKGQGAMRFLGYPNS